MLLIDNLMKKNDLLQPLIVAGDIGLVDGCQTGRSDDVPPDLHLCALFFCSKLEVFVD